MNARLHYRSFGEGDPLVIVHGLLGSGTNWVTFARQLAGTRRVILPDLINHGRSPHRFSMNLPELAGDIEALLDDLGLERVAMAGHSLGGKLAMHLALTRPDLVERLLVIDIAPVRYPDRHGPLLDAMLHLDLAACTTREDVEDALAPTVPDAAVRQFLLMNLRRRHGRWTWGVNLKAIRAALAELMDFPETPAMRPFTAPTLFLTGERSDYIRREHRPAIGRWFPDARLRTIPGAGHWIHADAPDAFADAFHDWLTG